MVEYEAWENLIRGDIAKRGLPLDKLQAPFWKARIYNRLSSVMERIKALCDWRSFDESDFVAFDEKCDKQKRVQTSD